jgi:osmotically-inducible protein OsmY
MPEFKSLDVHFTLDDSGQVVMTGQVKSEEQARLAENVVRLEPGVNKVRNELTYPETPSNQ